ncbi:hypothetical protein STAQ_31280 [Allostella sp. ATCC 35155]|nr:hypothetical protein STAQ_31280 [Stella sp. ATCC 35155]
MTMVGRPPVRLVVVDSSLLDVDMHNFNFARGVVRDGPKLGLAPRMVIPRRAAGRLADAIGASAVLSMSVDDLLMHDGLSWRIADAIDGGAMLADDLEALDGPDAIDGAVMLLPTATAREILGLALTIERGPRPLAVVLGFHELKTGETEQRSTNQALGLLRYATNRLRRVFPAERILASATTGPLAKRLAGVLNHTVRLWPHPMWYDLAAPAPDPAGPAADGRATIAVLGGTRRDKGGELLVDIARHAQPLAARARLLVQLMPRSHGREGNPIAEGLADDPLVVVRRGMLPESALLHHCGTVDAILLPYEPDEYRERASGIFALAVAMGRPVIVSDGTWMAERLREGAATGLIVAVHAAFAYARAMAAIVDDRARFLEAAALRAASWRERENGVQHLATMIRVLSEAGVWPAGHMGSSG